MERFPQDDEDSSVEEDQIFDEDECPITEIENIFPNKYTIFSEECAFLKKTYVLHLSENQSSDKLAVGLSNGSVNMFNLSTYGLERLSDQEFTSGEETIVCGVKFLDDNNILIGNASGTIELYDLRTCKKEFSFKSDEDSKTTEKKTFTCFDVNSNGRLICAGTEQILDDVFLLFFDIRGKSLLGGYWESHQDDITSVRFHPRNPDLLISGSTDGLINIFDLSQSTEEDALCTVINTEDSVDKLNWHKDVYERDLLSCITHTNDLKIYEVNEGNIWSKFSRQDIAKSLKRMSVSHCNTINCHNLNNDSIFLLAGSNYNKGEVLRSLLIQNKRLQPLFQFEDNKQIIRTSIFNQNANRLITGGESGIVTVWTNENCNHQKMQNNLKLKSKKSSTVHTKKPY